MLCFNCFLHHKLSTIHNLYASQKALKHFLFLFLLNSSVHDGREEKLYEIEKRMLHTGFVSQKSEVPQGHNIRSQNKFVVLLTLVICSKYLRISY